LGQGGKITLDAGRAAGALAARTVRRCWRRSARHRQQAGRDQLSGEKTVESSRWDGQERAFLMNEWGENGIRVRGWNPQSC
jgi:hypothetical protein